MLHHHTNRVIFLRLVLPVIAIAGLITVIAWPILNEIKEKAVSANVAISAEDIALAAPTSDGQAQLQVMKPEFTGVTSQGQPYTVTADRVLQGLQMNTPMTLEKPRAAVSLDDAASAAISSQSGIYDPKAETLDLQNDVTVTHSDGYTLNLQDLAVDLKNGIAVTKNPVSGIGPAGSLEAQEMELRDKGNHIILHGKSKLVLNPKKKT
jgi:lipopolysaccharide export system protein LptC